MTNTAQVQELLKYLEKGGEFVSTQAPLVAQDIIKAEYVSNITQLIISGIIIIVCIVFLVHFIKKYKQEEYYSDEKDNFLIISIVSGIAGFILLVPFIDAIYSLIYLNLFPRLVILDYIKHIL
jgi:heme/copper-type cytochrome/quinol oxidase subunit 2